MWTLIFRMVIFLAGSLTVLPPLLGWTWFGSARLEFSTVLSTFLDASRNRPRRCKHGRYMLEMAAL